MFFTVITVTPFVTSLSWVDIRTEIQQNNNEDNTCMTCLTKK